ncbi:sporulation protein, partial [Bacillus pumilus]|uniref:sporulation protein n=1 Tax=Bacillus pumilus TaxID=1408 RepID=UPI0016431757
TNLPFHLNQPHCHQPPYFHPPLPFLQQFHFIPTSHHYRYILHQLHLIFLIDQPGLDIVFEVDRRGTAPRRWLDE